ncbi:MAG: hypothetical protein Q7R39_19070 [Dehalococcoidia bacterium]|nr:hypothetical protein [Dehalococcoidia bacterium]
MGFAVTNDGGVPLWDTWQLYGLDNVGYPLSSRFVWGGYLTQVFQKAVFQSRPDLGGVAFVNVFDELHNWRADSFLLVNRQTPLQVDPSFDAGKPPEQIVQARLALLDANGAIRDRYFSGVDPLLLYGLPTSAVQDMGNAFVIRTQRAVFQQWKVDVPWASAGQVTVANGGDIAKEEGLFPTDMIQNGASVNPLQPQPPP